jgi:hypothetical protein
MSDADVILQAIQALDRKIDALTAEVASLAAGMSRHSATAHALAITANAIDGQRAKQAKDRLAFDLAQLLVDALTTPKGKGALKPAPAWPH